MKNKEFLINCDQLDVLAEYRLDEVELLQDKWEKGPRFPKKLPLQRSIEQLEIWDGCIYLKKKSTEGGQFFLNFEDIDGFLLALLIFQSDEMIEMTFNYDVGSGSIKFVRRSETKVDLYFFQEECSPLLFLEQISVEEIREIVKLILNHMNQEFLSAIEKK